MLMYDVQSNTWTEQSLPPQESGEQYGGLMYAFAHKGSIVVMYSSGLVFHRGTGSDPNNWSLFNLDVASDAVYGGAAHADAACRGAARGHAAAGLRRAAPGPRGAGASAGARASLRASGDAAGRGGAARRLASTGLRASGDAAGRRGAARAHAAAARLRGTGARARR